MNVDLEDAALRRLARALTTDAAHAEDLVQDTWSAAFAHPPREDRPVRPWLRMVLLNRRRSHLRKRHPAPLGVDPTSTQADAEQHELARRLSEVLHGLPEADQELLHLRFFEGLSAAECAARLGCPASTVRSRLHRALRRLRKHLDGRGGRDAWLPGLVAWVHGPVRPARSSGALTVGGALAATIMWLAVSLPQGCGATGETTPPDASDPRGASHARSAEHELAENEPASRSPSAPETSNDRRALPRAAYRDGKLVHPKLAVHVARSEVHDVLADCGADVHEAMVRLRPTIVFEADGSAAVTDVESVFEEGLTGDDRECIEQALLSMDIPDSVPVEDMTHPYAFRPTFELYFTEGDVEEVSVRRGPPRQLISRAKDGSDLARAVEACADSAPRSVHAALAFEPISGELRSVTPHEESDSDLVRCLHRAVGEVLFAVPFEPKAPEDAMLECTFDLSNPGEHTCRRLGPGGGYVEIPEESGTITTR